MKDVSTTPIYVSPTGDDSNDGLSEDRPVRSFSRAIEIGNGLPRNNVISIVAAAGTYDNDANNGISLMYRRCVVQLNGNITLVGRIALQRNSYLFILGDGYSLNIVASNTAHVIYIDQTSTFISNCTTNITASNITGNVISCFNNSLIYFLQQVNIEANVIDNYIINIIASRGTFVEPLTVTGTAANFGIYIERVSYCLFSKGLTIPNIIDNTVLGIFEGSNCRINTPTGYTSSLYGGPSAYGPLIVSYSSSLAINGSGLFTITHRGQSWGAPIITQNGCFRNFGNLKLVVESGKTAYYFVLCTNTSCVRFESGTVEFVGTVTGATVASSCEALIVFANVTLSGTPTSPKRYLAQYCASIDTVGKGANFIPGSAAGTLDNYGTYR